VWANMLHQVYAALVAAKGFNPDKLRNPDDGSGNVVFMQLFIESLSIQPCNPTCEYLPFLLVVVALEHCFAFVLRSCHFFPNYPSPFPHHLRHTDADSLIPLLVVQARDAWLKADEIRFNGEHKCLISKAFASRGLGIGADKTFNDDFTAIEGCE